MPSTWTERARSSKVAEDRHIGFRWLAREARLPVERDAEHVFRALEAPIQRTCSSYGWYRNFMASQR
jgi:hypothetical protein